MYDLRGRTALVTGAATGLGQAISVILSKAGAMVAVTDKPGVGCEETMTLCKRAECRCINLEMDIRKLSEIQEAVSTIESKWGRVDILVNNAGINHPAPALDVDPMNWDEHFNTNVRGGFFCAQAVAPKMIAQGFGRIIFISSQSGIVGIPGQAAYCASKGAIINLVRSLGVEWAKHGITVNSVAPTFVETNLTRERLQGARFREFVLGKIPKGELALPDDVAHAVAFLASNEAGMINCANIPVDGGWTAW